MSSFTLTDTQLTGLGTDTLSGIERASLTGGAGNNTLDATRLHPRRRRRSTAEPATTC